MRELVAITSIEGVMAAGREARSYLYVGNGNSGRGVSSWVGGQAAEDAPAYELDYWRNAVVFLFDDVVAGAEAPNQDIAREAVLGLGGERYAGRATDGMPVPKFGGDGQAFTESLVIQKGRLDTVVIRSQAAKGIAGREVSPELKREIAIFSGKHGILEAGANVAYSGVVCQASRARRELDEAYRGFYKNRNTAIRRVLEVQLQFLKINAFCDTQSWPGSIEIAAGAIATAFGVEEFGAVRILQVEIGVKSKADFRADDSVVDVAGGTSGHSGAVIVGRDRSGLAISGRLCAGDGGNERKSRAKASW
jgi:hypothetical protein